MSEQALVIDVIADIISSLIVCLIVHSSFFIFLKTREKREQTKAEIKHQELIKKIEELEAKLGEKENNNS